MDMPGKPLSSTNALSTSGRCSLVSPGMLPLAVPALLELEFDDTLPSRMTHLSLKYVPPRSFLFAFSNS